MLQKGDQGTDRPDTDPGKITEETRKQNKDIQNVPAISRETILSEDEEARKFFDKIQSLRAELNSLRKQEGLAVPEQKDVRNVPKQYVQAAAAAGTVEPAPPQPATAADTAEPAPPQPAAAPAPVNLDSAPAPAAEAPAPVSMDSEPAEPATTGTVEPTPPESAAVAGTAEPAEAAEAPAPVNLDSAPEETAAKAFESQFRQQMESQMHTVRKEAYRREKAARNAERREERRARAKRKQQERELRAEVKRKKRLAARSAEMGGGIVTTHDTTVSTEIQPVARFSLRDLLGFVPPSEKRAAESHEELQALLEEQEKKTADARAAATQLSRVRANRYRNSALGRRADAFKKFCERHKALLLTGLSMVLLVCVGAAGVINYCTVYEYSYNGHVLGYVKSKDQVLQITDMVQKALTEDKELQVVIDTKDDITFERVSLLDRDVTPDSSEEVLRRLTYMGDLNVKAYGIYVNGEKAGSVQSKEAAAEVLKIIEDRYASRKKGTEIEKAEILETVDVHRSNSSLRDVYSPEQMAELLCSSGHKESVHTVIAGETLDDIAKMYGTTEERLLTDNEGVDPRQLKVGSTLLVRQNAPLLTVRMTEKRSYVRTIDYKTKKKKTDEMYEDETLVEQEGKDGSESITERTVSVNGEVEETKILNDVVTKKPVTKIVLVGTAERPPTVGDGVYIWPLEGGYTLTSHYGYRWGRLHAGIDLGTPTGNDVLAADGGIVVRAGYFGGYGYCVDIDHQNGQMTRYGHLSSILVSVGEGVYEGQHIAESGNSGRSTGPHLHFEIHNNGSTHDPLQDLP